LRFPLWKAENRPLRCKTSPQTSPHEGEDEARGQGVPRT